MKACKETDTWCDVHGPTWRGGCIACKKDLFVMQHRPTGMFISRMEVINVPFLGRVPIANFGPAATEALELTKNEWNDRITLLDQLHNFELVSVRVARSDA